MGGGGVNLVSEAMSPEEVNEVLARSNLKQEVLTWEQIGGRGGRHTVIRIAIFASLGGMLFGLDIGYIAGIKSMSSFEEDVLGGRSMTAKEDADITMIFGVGAAVAAFPPMINVCVDKLGRKGSVIAGGFVFCLGAAAQGFASSIGVVMVGRFIAGMSVGLLSANVPVYLSEIAPPSHRGKLVSVFQLAVTIGIMVSFVIALVLQDVQRPIGGWRWVIFVQLIPGIALALGGMFMGESPRWLVQKQKANKALEILEKIRSPEDDVKLELAQICKGQEKEAAAGKPTWGEFLSRDNWKLLGIGVALQLLQQMCGMNAYMYDGPKIFRKLFASKNAGFVFTAISGCVNIISTLPSIFLVDKVGRVTLLKFSAAGMALCSAVLAIVGTMCFPVHKCHRAAGEDCHNEEAIVCGDWAKWTATASICFFIFNFGYGWGPVVWTYCAEMFPMKYRTKATALTTDANWIGNIFIAFIPPLLLRQIGFNTFWVFFGVNVVGFALASALPETRGKSLEEIQTALIQAEDSAASAPAAPLAPPAH